jgi:hypothetical protein
MEGMKAYGYLIGISELVTGVLAYVPAGVAVWDERN